MGSRFFNMNGSNGFMHMIPNIYVSELGDAFAFGNALEFDGVNDYVSHTSYTLGGSTVPFSLSIWSKFGSTVVTNGKNLIGISSSATDFIDIISATSIRIRLNNTVYSYAIPSITTNWFHLAVSKDTSNDMRVYINSVESTSSAQNVGTRTLANINNLGTRAGTVTDAVRIDQYAVWNNHALSGAEITTLYNGGTGNFINSVGGTPIIVYELNESGTDTTAVNSGSGGATYNGTLNNFPASGMWGAHEL